jgi:hypothetical protein
MSKHVAGRYQARRKEFAVVGASAEKVHRAMDAAEELADAAAITKAHFKIASLSAEAEAKLLEVADVTGPDERMAVLNSALATAKEAVEAASEALKGSELFHERKVQASKAHEAVRSAREEELEKQLQEERARVAAAQAKVKGMMQCAADFLTSAQSADQAAAAADAAAIPSRRRARADASCDADNISTRRNVRTRRT